MNSINDKLGVWFIGCLGDIATTIISGSYAIQKGLTSTSGLMTAQPPVSNLELIPLENMIFGGIDIRQASIIDSAENLYIKSRTLSRETLDKVYNDLELTNNNVQVNSDLHLQSALPLHHIVALIRQYIADFKADNNLENVIVVDVSSAESAPAEISANTSYDELLTRIDKNSKQSVSMSILYALAAFSENCSHINFTPNTGASIKGLQDYAMEKNMLYFGNDGKTGETLIKTALAPMFLYRNLQVMSWEGINLLGNSDGQTLNDTNNRTSKIQNKSNVLPNILGYDLHSGVDIKYVPSLGDWKTAWDLIHFRGFLDVGMTMQFTWQGCDSILAAPLILDMIRLTDFARRQNETGAMKQLSCFFKNPIGVGEMNFYKQIEMLFEYTGSHLNKLNP